MSPWPRTTHQLELALDGFFRWLAERGVTDLQSLTALHVRDFVPSLKRFRPGTLHVHASALRGFLRYLHLKESWIRISRMRSNGLDAISGASRRECSIRR